MASEEEGPTAFLTTWYLRGLRESVNEESRTLRLDQYQAQWQQDLVDLWRDRIDITRPLEFALVHPEPPRHDFSWAIGHLIVYQNFEYPLVPVLLTAKFLTGGHIALNHAAMASNSPTSEAKVRDLGRLQRFCVDHHCVLQLSGQQFQQEEPGDLATGNSLIFNIYPPADTFHFGEAQEATLVGYQFT